MRIIRSWVSEYHSPFVEKYASYQPAYHREYMYVSTGGGGGGGDN